MSIASRARHVKVPSPNSSTMLHANTDARGVTTYTRIQRPRKYGALTAFDSKFDLTHFQKKANANWAPTRKTKGFFGAATAALRALGLMKRRQAVLAKLTPEKVGDILTNLPAETAGKVIEQHKAKS